MNLKELKAYDQGRHQMIEEFYLSCTMLGEDTKPLDVLNEIIIRREREILKKLQNGF